jgi:hypothetical protein
VTCWGVPRTRTVGGDARSRRNPIATVFSAKEPVPFAEGVRWLTVWCFDDDHSALGVSSCAVIQQASIHHPSPCCVSHSHPLRCRGSIESVVRTACPNSTTSLATAGERSIALDEISMVAARPTLTRGRGPSLYYRTG